MTEKIKVEIWSDVVCPFCYIGKRHFENALQSFEGKEDVEIIWKSFQLNPDQVTDTSITIFESLARSKGWSAEQTKNTTSHVTEMAANAGLKYDFDKIVVANTFNAHRLIQFAKTKNKGDEMEERLFKAYFMEGKNIDDMDTLALLGQECGLEPAEIATMLESEQFKTEVTNDILEASQIGVRGVPFFVFDRKYAVSGAQPEAAFLQTLQTIQKEKYVEPTPAQDVAAGASCEPQGKCD
ncbi:MAG: DsbA family oxidoreductase [Flavobacteriales bacterium]